MATDTLFTPAEASALTALSVKRINKLIDERLPAGAVRKQRGRRLITYAGLVCLALEKDISADLTVATRRRVFRRILEAPTAREVAGGARIKVDVAETRRTLAAKRRHLARAMERLVRADPDILGGALCFRDTRIPIHLVSTLLRQGAAIEEVLQDYPSLTAEMVETAPMLARAYPRRGRPPKRSWPDGAPSGARRVA